MTERTLSSPPDAMGRVPRQTSRWLMLLAFVLLGGIISPASAQSRDVITFTNAKVGAADADGTFQTGAPSTEYPGAYVIDVGDADIHEGIFTVTLSRPLGASATRPASVTLTNMYLHDEATVVFEPGETTKTVELFAGFIPVDGYEDENGERHEVYTWNGNLPAMYAVRASHADAVYELLILKINRTGADAPRQSTFATKLEVLQNTFGNDHADYSVTRWGEYMLFKFFLATDVKIANDSRYVINARFADHTNLGPDDDDYGLARSHEVELRPINAGSVCSEAWYLYRPTDDEYLHSLEDNITEWSDRTVKYPVLEVGPFEVANPAEDAVKYIFYSRSDLPEESANSLYSVYLRVDGLMPHFSDVSINKDSFNSGETMVITATMDNWPFVRRCQGDRFRSAFGVTLDDNETLEPCRYTFDEQTGQVTYYVTAPTVTETTTVYVDFGPAFEGTEGKKVQSKSENSFAVSVLPQAATPNPITEFDIPGLPADNSLIVLKEVEQFIAAGWYDTWVERKQYSIVPVYTPLDATNANQITYAVANAGGANAEIIYGYKGVEGVFLYAGTKAGTVTFTASVGEEVVFSRSYTIMRTVGDELDRLAMPEPMNHSNQYLVGTVFPQLQFELKNPDERPLDDDITVSFTHANGTTWTETYSLHTLKSRQTDRGSIVYDLPFSFTEEHPDVTDDSQIGQTVITAQVAISVPTTDGPKETITCTARLVSDMKKISIGDYYEYTAAYNDAHPVTLTSEVMYLPRQGFTVGYEIPELNEKQTYNSLTDGDNVPEWLELQQNDYYYTANIKVTRQFDASLSKCHLFTLAQRSYSADEVMLRELTTVANLEFVGPEGHLVFRINGEEVSGDVSFDNSAAIENLIQTKLLPAGGFMSYDELGSDIVDIVRSTAVHFVAYDDVYGGAEVTLKCGDEVIQTTKNYNAAFFFLPPMDGRTYTVEVYFPGYDRRYTCNIVSHPFNNVYHIGMQVLGETAFHIYYKDVLRWYNNGTPWEVTFPYNYQHENYGYLYIENPTDFYLSYRPKDEEAGAPLTKPLIRIGGLNLRPVNGTFLAQLTHYGDVYSMDNAQNNEFSLSAPNLETLMFWTDMRETKKAYFYRGGYVFDRLRWDQLASRNTLVTVVNGQGESVNNATINFATIDNTMTLQGNAGTTNYDGNLGAYQIATDPDQYAEFIEVVAPGYQPTLARMYMSDYNHTSWENRGKMRKFTIVLDESNNPMKSLALETMKRSGNLQDNKMQAAVSYEDLLMIGQSQQLDYSETADYATVTKYMNEGKFGRDGWSGTKWVHLTGQMACDANFDASQLRLQGGALNLEPALAKVISPQEFTTFSGSYCLFDFDLADKIDADATVQPLLKSGTTTLAELPLLHNQTIDLMALNEANNIEMSPGGFDLTKVDDDAEAQGMDMKDSGKAFDQFDFQVPPVLPFTVNIQRDGDHFMIRAVCEVNFLPGGPIMDQLDKLENLQYFEEQFTACMDAVNSAKPADDDFFEDIPRLPSAFVGIKGYLSGVAYYNRETNKLDVNFYDGGLTFEASAKASANLSFGIGSFGMSVDAMIAMSMGLVNTAAEMGDASFKSTKIDFVFDYQTRLKVCAWAYAGIDLWIAKAVAGVRGGACIDLHHRAYVAKGQAGMKTTLHAQMEAFAEARFLFFKAKKTWPIFKYHKEYLVPNSPSNPFHPSNAEPIFSMSRRNVTKGYKKLKRRVIADLGTPIINNVNGMAQPTYLMDGASLLFNNLNTPSNYNDDRLQVYSEGSKDDFISTGVEAPMYDFSTARNVSFEMVAFEQLENAIDGDAINSLTENDQTKAVSENSRVRIAWRERDGSVLEEAPMGNWSTMEASDVSGNMACVNPAVAVTTHTGDITTLSRGAVVWQQGTAKFNSEGTRYIDGSMMLRRHSAYPTDLNTEPIEIKRINRRNVPVDYQVAMKDDSVLVMMTLQQDVENQDKAPSMVYVSVSPDDKVRERYTMIEGSKPQMANVGGGILVAYLKHNEEGRDLVLNTVNMKGETTGKLAGPLGMDKRMVNDYRLVVQNGFDPNPELRNVALLWSQSDEERTENGDGTVTVNFKNRIFASLLNSHDNQLFFSAPIEIATMPDDVSLVSMDGYLNGLDLKVAYCVANEQDGAAVLETAVTFTNAYEHSVSFNPYDVTDDTQVPVRLKVVNNGYDPIINLAVTMDGKTTNHSVTILPQESAEVTVNYTLPDNFDGTISYDVAAEFCYPNSGALKSRRKGAPARPRRIAQSGTQVDVRQVDMALKVLSKKTDAQGLTTIVAEVNNASLLPLADDMTVKVGLYSSPVADENATTIAETSVSAADLYDATAEQKNKVKIVTLTAQQPDLSQVLYLRTMPVQNGETVKDVRPSNNVLPVRLVGKYLKGDVNRDGRVDMLDAMAVVNHILGKPQAGDFYEQSADVNDSGSVTIADAAAIVSICLR